MSKSANLKRNQLPSKEASLFKELLTLYETRQLKKGLKTADQILKKFPEHGETLSMKGLVLTHMGKREEGIDFVKKGIKLDITSHIVWHVFGLIQKADKDYEQALKSYGMALKYDKENMNLLRDSAQLQTHLRLYENLVETRHTILRLRPNQRQNWIALAVAHHLNGNLEESRKVLEEYFLSLKNVPDYDIEHSETLLYYINILEELGDLSTVLTVLDQNAKSRSIVDRLAILETRARVLSKQKASEAEDAWQALIEHNSDNYDSYRGYLANQGISLDQSASEAIDALEKFALQLPRATAPRRMQLDLATGDQFKALVKPYITHRLEKGIPSLFADLKALYVDHEKREAIGDIVDALREEYTPPSDSTSSTSKDVDPSTYLWTLYFLSQHYSHLSQHHKSLTLLDIALSHTPTLPELFMLKGRILKRVGDYVGAAKAINDARLLDGQDRFLNTKCGKYLLRAGMVDEAMGVLGLFTKKDAPSPAADLQDMQSFLVILEEADAHRRNGKLNLALKKYMAVKSVFDDFEHDQFDFHGYNLRKFMINIYLKLLKWEDNLRSHPLYVKAAIEASKIFVQVSDDPSIVTNLSSSNQLTDAEKKAKKKAKKAEKKKVEEEKKAAPQSNADKELDDPPKKDEDPDGFKLLGSPDALEQAAKILHPLSILAPQNVDAWIAIYDVAIRRRKLLQAASALTHASSLSPTHPQLHIRIADLKQRATALPQQPPALIGPIFLEAVGKLFPEELSIDTFNSQYLQRHGGDAMKVLAVAKVMEIGGFGKEGVENHVFSILGKGVNLDISTALSAVDFLTSLKSTRVQEFKETCQTKFELSTIFKSPDQIAVLKQSVLTGESLEVGLEGKEGEEVKEGP